MRELRDMLTRFHIQKTKAIRASDQVLDNLRDEGEHYMRIVAYHHDPHVPERTPESYIAIVDRKDHRLFMGYVDPIGGLSARDVAGTDTVPVEEALAMAGNELMRKIREIWK